MTTVETYAHAARAAIGTAAIATASAMRAVGNAIGRSPVGRAARVVNDAIGRTRIGRTWHAIMAVAKRHLHPSIFLIFTLCLWIPGPFDELGLLIVVAIYTAFKADMRRDFARTVPQAWSGQ